jgi:hypothetical protein
MIALFALLCAVAVAQVDITTTTMSGNSTGTNATTIMSTATVAANATTTETSLAVTNATVTESTTTSDATTTSESTTVETVSTYASEYWPTEEPTTTTSPPSSSTGQPLTSTTLATTKTATTAANATATTTVGIDQGSIRWPAACGSCDGGDNDACVFQLPTAARREPFVCASGACGSGGPNEVCTKALARGCSLLPNSTAAAQFFGCPDDSNATLACNKTAGSSSAACQVCAPAAETTCAANEELTAFCEPYELCGTPDTYCLSSGTVVTGSLRCMPAECLVCGGEVASCAVLAWPNRTVSFGGCLPSPTWSEAALLRYTEPLKFARWRQARLRFKLAPADISLTRLVAALGGSPKHIQTVTQLEHGDDVAGGAVFVDAVVRMPSPMMYNLEALLRHPRTTAARDLASRFGIIAFERVDDAGGGGDTVAPVVDAANRAAVATLLVGAAAGSALW